MTIRRVLPPGTDWRLDDWCGIGGRCYQMSGVTNDTAAAVASAATSNSQAFWRAVGVGVGVTLAVRVIDRILSRVWA